jgi:diguanylate cyclase (GGDEF)-like protein/putative nucleotidyltransferase with HDIG domain
MRTRAPKPFLLMIVFGVLLVIVGVTATAQTVLVSLHISTATLNATVASDAATVRTFVNGLVQPDDLRGLATPDRLAAVDKGLGSLAERGQILRIEIRDPAGVVRLSNEPLAVGGTSEATAAFARAVSGTVDATLIETGVASEALGPAIPATYLLREYLPLMGDDGTAQGVVGLWRDAGPILTAIDKVRGDVLLVTLSAAVVVALILFLVFRAAQRRITVQTQQLLESERLDPLTGLPNHGAVVGDLAVAIESVRSGGAAIGVALIDVDNFTLVNDTYGHAAGDRALRQIAREIEARLPEGSIAGRYGPDEYLVVTRTAAAQSLAAMVEAIQVSLAAQSLDVDATERLPITISAGIAVYPDHASSATALLSVVAVELAAAKASGGDATRIAGVFGEAPALAGGFDVLQGLVFAVDTKDRYTKRHSEDVARYAVFLARLLKLDPDLIEGIRAAGLLHDVGKIGIPDSVLRKPGRLTAEENQIVKQHVALGDSIVRNVDRIDLVRAGIRHHHERWDGRGYLDALAGEDIPLVARILAVADAFSAMTTTRPYRKALSVEEALRRLGDAAGTQLDERLAGAFIRGIETVPDAPQPGAITSAALWVPRAVGA